MLIARNLTKTFSTSRGSLTAVDRVSLEIKEGQTLGLVGESGCGKSTLGRLLLRLIEPTSGSVHFDGIDILSLSPSELKKWRQEAQIIFQDPYASLNPRMTIEDIVTEPLKIHKIAIAPEIIIEALNQVGLNPEHRWRYPHEFSGGQRQRIGIARALILNPSFIVCDEPITALDVSVQAQIVNLLKDLQHKLGLTYLFISHDLRMVKYIADRVAVMYLGKIVEQGPTDQVFANPQHPYTQALISAIPTIEKSKPHLVLTGDLPSPIHPPPGCAFSTRCPHATDLCRSQTPKLESPASELNPERQTACHLVSDGKSKSDMEKPVKFP
jgi:oligopeptide/dipeptide ABC transporter ATP-binding protein